MRAIYNDIIHSRFCFIILACLFSNFRPVIYISFSISDLLHTLKCDVHVTSVVVMSD